MKRPNRPSRVSLLTNSLTTFSRFTLSVRSMWNFRRARELNLAGNILDHSQVFRFLANENVLSAVALVARLTTGSWNKNKILSGAILHMLSYIFKTYKTFILTYSFEHMKLDNKLINVKFTFIYTFHIADFVCNAFIG